MHVDIYGYTSLVAGFILAAILVWQGFKTWRLKTASRVEIAKDEAYRKLAEESISAQQKLVESQQKIAEELSAMRERIASIEKVLREVE